MGVVGMKVHHHLPRTTPAPPFFWEQQQQQQHDQQQLPSLSLSSPISSSSTTKRLRPLAPKLASPPPPPPPSPSPSPSSFDLKSFIRPDSGSRRASTSPSDVDNKHSFTTTTTMMTTTTTTSQHPGGTRWNPTQEQIGILEMLYRGGMRTPNAHQIEQITSQLGRYGKIEGKNVFYWFQNHKARERQKQKRTTLGLSHSPRTAAPSSATPPPFAALDIRLAGDEMVSPCKRKCRSWGIQRSEFDHDHYRKQEISGRSSSGSSGGGGEDDENHDEKVAAAEEDQAGRGDRTLALFPLHPEGRRLSSSSSA